MRQSPRCISHVVYIIILKRFIYLLIDLQSVLYGANSVQITRARIGRSALRPEEGTLWGHFGAPVLHLWQCTNTSCQHGQYLRTLTLGLICRQNDSYEYSCFLLYYFFRTYYCPAAGYSLVY